VLSVFPAAFVGERMGLETDGRRPLLDIHVDFRCGDLKLAREVIIEGCELSLNSIRATPLA
jgi:hypothetical protein